MRLLAISMTCATLLTALQACNNGGSTSDASDAPDASSFDSSSSTDVLGSMPDTTADRTDLGAADSRPEASGPPCPTSPRDPNSDSQLLSQRQGCTFVAGACPAQTLGSDAPIGTAIPIDHILVLMQENRSFDSYYSHLPQYAANPQPDVNVAPATFSNPGPDGGVVMRQHDTSVYCFADTNHEWTGSHLEWDNGANDGFAQQNVDPTDPTGSRSLYWYDEADIPFYYSLASTFAIADAYFSAVMGPTYPNRFFSMAATSFGYTYNTVVGSSRVDLQACKLEYSIVSPK